MEAEQHNVAIFWDYENCEIPATVDGYAITSGIRRIAHEYGSVTAFKAYCPTPELMSPKYSTMRSELHVCGVSVIDCPHNGRKDTADKKMMVDMLAHAIDNPAPSTIILISGDGDFGYAVATLRWRRYRVIVLAPSNCTHYGLKAQANKVYEWPKEVLSPEVLATNLPAASGSRSGIGLSMVENFRPAYTVVGGSNRTLSSPNTPQFTGQSKLSSGATSNARVRSNSVQHTRSASTPTAQQPSTSSVHHLVTPKKVSSTLVEVPMGHGGGVRNPVLYADAGALSYATPSFQDFLGGQVAQETDRIHGLQKLRRLTPTTPSIRPGSLSPLAPAVSIDGPRDLSSHEEQTEGRDGDDSALDMTEDAEGPADRPEASDRLTPLASGEQQEYVRAPLQLPLPADITEARPETSDNAANTSDEIGRIPDTETAEALDDGLITVRVRPDMVIPEVIMTQITRPPYLYKAMIIVLERERLRGNTRVMFSQLGALVRQEDQRAYAKAGVTQLKEYVAKAEQAGVVIVSPSSGLHSMNGNRWTALHPLYHGNGRAPDQAPPAPQAAQAASGAMSPLPYPS